MKRLSLLTLAVGVCVVRWAWVASAADPAGPADSSLQAAKTEFEDGQALFLQEKFDDAAAKFLTAYERKPFAAFLFNAAVSYERGHKLAEAVQFFEKYLQADPEAADAADVKSRIEGLKATLTPPAPPPAPTDGGPPPTITPPRAVLPTIATKGLVIVDSKPPGASIYLDDKKRGVFARTPWQGSLAPRAVKLIVESKGFKPEERRISPRTDKIYEVYIALSEEHFLGWIEVVANVPGAEVFLDRREIGAIGRTPYTGHVKPGKHTVWVQRPGYQVARKDIEVLPGTATTHTLTLEHVANGWITVAGRFSKGARLKVDGAYACETPCQHLVSAGRHAVAIEKPGMETYKGDVNVDRAQEVTLDPSFGPKPPRSKAWTAAVLSAAFFGGGIYLGTKANGIRDELKNESQSPASLLDTSDGRVSRGKYYAIGADVLFGLGALTAIMSAVGFLSGGPDSTAEVNQRSISLSPVLGPGGGGLSASGRF
jgi:hypothetical protein